MSILKILTYLCVMKQKIRIKNTFAGTVYNVLIVEEVSLKINGKQTVKLSSGSIKFKNHFKQLAAPFKIYLHFPKEFFLINVC